MVHNNIYDTLFLSVESRSAQIHSYLLCTGYIIVHSKEALKFEVAFDERAAEM